MFINIYHYFFMDYAMHFLYIQYTVCVVVIHLYV